MKIGIIIGSHRENSESGRVGAYLAAQWAKLDLGQSVIISLEGNPLPLWDPSAWNGESDLSKQMQPYKEKLSACDGFVVISPEWSGMVPAALKNFFLLCSAQELAHKPALIVGVSSGRGGTYPVTELRTSSYKNTKICYIPEHIIIRDVNNMLKGDVPQNEEDGFIRERIDFALTLLLEYCKALVNVRKSGKDSHPKFAYGM